MKKQNFLPSKNSLTFFITKSSSLHVAKPASRFFQLMGFRHCRDFLARPRSPYSGYQPTFAIVPEMQDVQDACFPE
jgi:hypothetical protein